MITNTNASARTHAANSYALQSLITSGNGTAANPLGQYLEEVTSGMGKAFADYATYKVSGNGTVSRKDFQNLVECETLLDIINSPEAIAEMQRNTILNSLINNNVYLKTILYGRITLLYSGSVYTTNEYGGEPTGTLLTGSIAITNSNIANNDTIMVHCTANSSKSDYWYVNNVLVYHTVTYKEATNVYKYFSLADLNITEPGTYPVSIAVGTHENTLLGIEVYYARNLGSKHAGKITTVYSASAHTGAGSSTPLISASIPMTAQMVADDYMSITMTYTPSSSSSNSRNEFRCYFNGHEAMHYPRGNGYQNVYIKPSDIGVNEIGTLNITVSAIYGYAGTLDITIQNISR